MRLDLEVTVVAPHPGGDRLGVLVTVVDGRLLEGEQVEAAEVVGLLDRLENPIELQPEVDVPGAEPEPRRGCAGDVDKGNKVVGRT
jgi:hypothetical protein